LEDGPSSLENDSAILMANVQSAYDLVDATMTICDKGARTSRRLGEFEVEILCGRIKVLESVVSESVHNNTFRMSNALL
jgi:hypothetical protein